MKTNRKVASKEVEVVKVKTMKRHQGVNNELTRE